MSISPVQNLVNVTTSYSFNVSSFGGAVDVVKGYMGRAVQWIRADHPMLKRAAVVCAIAFAALGIGCIVYRAIRALVGYCIAKRQAATTPNTPKETNPAASLLTAPDVLSTATSSTSPKAKSQEEGKTVTVTVTEPTPPSPKVNPTEEPSETSGAEGQPIESLDDQKNEEQARLESERAEAEKIAAKKAEIAAKNAEIDEQLTKLDEEIRLKGEEIKGHELNLPEKNRAVEGLRKQLLAAKKAGMAEIRYTALHHEYTAACDSRKAVKSALDSCKLELEKLRNKRRDIEATKTVLEVG